MSDWESVIGLEIHAQLATRSKIFSGASTAFGAEPNTQACAVDLGMPGVLPVLNREAVNMAIRFGVAIDAEIDHHSVFARKNYFYPDLPKGYQISQYELPIVGKGHVFISPSEGEHLEIGITRAHLEEDAGKSIHDLFPEQTGIDLNRAGTPLLEIVSEPDMRSAKQAVAYARKIHSLVRYLEICDGNMQEGSFRCDANVSVRRKGEQKLGTRAELKNINSFRFLERAINFEIERQINLNEDGASVVQETRLYDAERDETRSMRSKEEANDYRYFPDPDLLPVVITDADIARIRDALPELPEQKKQRYINDLGLSDYNAELLTANRETAAYFEDALGDAPDQCAQLANWILGDLAGALNRAGLEITAAPITPTMLAQLMQRISDNTISGKIAKEVFEAMWQGEGAADDIIEARGLKQITDSGAIEALIDAVIAANPGQVEQFRAGKEKVLGFFVGQVMKQSQGKANPGQVNQVLRDKLKP
ncbi:MAG: Asp-tRNA(Asn)/Glu-tRNA(Gln) amidotransferase subunit GatB [Gammaproteobacteria bacterium]|nr:Asp-tRNA(Asn)/Glu-tRNA(Gln) amidotransferase subunit GatB [Gammaproteobacteria bacterium]MDH3534721.1 Asp-tRNA(Asn)/Glu-tRNA(Gln) amidotransferase subunit GatB [Gammaproteobacteria bacterium]